MEKFLYVISNCRIGGAENFLLRLARGLRERFPGASLECVVTHELGDLFLRYNETFDCLHKISGDEDRLHWAICELAQDASLIHSIDNLVLMGNVAKDLPEIPVIQNIFLDLSRPALRNCHHWRRDLDQASMTWAAAVTEIEGNLQHLPHARRKQAIGNGIDTEFWHPGEQQRQGVCWVGRITNEKGAFTLAQIIERMPETRFTVIANEPKIYQGFLHQEFLELSARVSNLDYRWTLSPELLRDVYQESLVYLHTSYTEAQPGTLLEAMACGCIPVCGAVGGIPEILQGECGIEVHEPKNIELFVQTLRETLASPPYELQQRARQRVEERFSIDNTVRQYAVIYREVMNS